MAWLFAVPVVGFVAWLVIGAITGRVKSTSCCSVADPRYDLRMRSAFLDVDQGVEPASRECGTPEQGPFGALDEGRGPAS